MNDKKKFEEFVNSIKKEKLSGFVDGEKSEIAVDYKLGYRLDHQGVSSPSAPQISLSYAWSGRKCCYLLKFIDRYTISRLRNEIGG